MGLTQVQRVKVGSIIRVKGVDYKVVSNRIGDLVLNKKVATGIFNQTEVRLKSLIPSASPSIYVDVVREPAIPGQNLTDKLKAQLTQQPAANGLTEQLRKQKAQKDLTASLRSQVEGKDDEEEKGCDCGRCTCGTLVAEGISPVKEVASANLRSQVAQQQATQARLDASIATSQIGATKEAVAELGKRLDVHKDAHNGLVDYVERIQLNQAVTEDTLSRGIAGLSRDVERGFAQVDKTIEGIRDDIEDTDHRTVDLNRRLSAIETKQKREELKMNIQQQLNASLAKKSLTSDLQAQLAGQKTNKTTGGNGTMKNLFGAFKNQFGKVEGKFAYSVVTGGLALRKGISNDFVAYDKESKSLTDVSGLTLKFDVPAFKLPVKEDAIAVGDLIIHNAEYVYVTGKADGYLETINPEKGIRGSVIPTKNAIFGAAFYTVVKTLDAAGDGGFNPMLLMALGKGNKDELLPLLLMSGGIGNGAKGAIDPTLLMLLGDEVEDLLPLVLMQQGGVAGQGFNPLMFLAMNKGGKLGDMLPLLMATGGLNGGGAQAGAINPMMLMALSDGGSDMKDLLMMQAITGQNIFGGAAPAAEVKAAEVKAAEKK